MAVTLKAPSCVGRLPAGRARYARANSARARRCNKHVVHATLEQEDAAMKAAEARWDAQIRDGVVKNVMARDVSKMQDDGWMILDVRPPNECKKVHVKDAIEVPLFVPDTAMDPGALIKQMSAFGMGGWWLGGTHMVPNMKFIQQVQDKVPRDAKVIVACQKGLRSLAACEQLSKAGYSNIAWVNGGFDNSKPGEIPTRENLDIRYAGIGGLSEVLGWTEVQQETAGPMSGVKGVLIAVGVIVALDVALLAYEQAMYMMGKTPF